MIVLSDEVSLSETSALKREKSSVSCALKAMLCFLFLALKLAMTSRRGTRGVLLKF